MNCTLKQSELLYLVYHNNATVVIIIVCVIECVYNTIMVFANASAAS